jgi:hypothetical protein
MEDGREGALSSVVAPFTDEAERVGVGGFHPDPGSPRGFLPLSGPSSINLAIHRPGGRNTDSSGLAEYSIAPEEGWKPQIINP